MIVPPLKDLQLMRRLKCSWQELQDTPEEYLEVWKAILDGEDQARRMKAASAAGRR